MRTIRRALWGFVALAALAVVAVALGLVPMSFVKDDGNRPPCSQLSTQEDVDRALATHGAFVRAIEAVPGAKVGVGRPCGNEDKALVSIHVDSNASRSAVDLLLRNGDGFGVPAEIVGN